MWLIIFTENTAKIQIAHQKTKLFHRFLFTDYNPCKKFHTCQRKIGLHHVCEARLAEGFFFALRKSHWGIGIKSLKPITISTFSPKDGYFPKILHNYSRKAAHFFGKAKERVKEGGEGRKEVKEIRPRARVRASASLRFLPSPCCPFTDKLLCNKELRVKASPFCLHLSMRPNLLIHKSLR